MIISQWSLNLDSEHRFSRAESVKEDLRIWIDAPAGGAGERVSIVADTVTISGKAEETLAEETHLDPKLLLLKRLLEALTGKEIRIENMSDIGETPDDLPEFQTVSSGASSSGRTNGREGWGLSYTRDTLYAESEQVTVKAEGRVTTEDGREINFSVSFSVSREFVSREHISIRAGDAKRVDPLVVNLDGSPIALSEVRFSFDLNADGKKEDIHFSGRGGGFLALDRNGDGIINDGRELFGPVTGSGFGELSRFDDDGNGWIDERDAVFSKLVIWTKDAEGNDSLRSFKQSGIGAISLARVAADFTFKNQRNEAQGIMTEAGVYLRENGTAGTLQQIDMVI